MCRGLHSEKSFGILTSGGDAPGMGSAVRGATATALSHGATVYAIMNGYAGLVAGGDMIKPLTWADLDGNCSAGGTPIGSARCAEFRTTEGRRKAALNMVCRMAAFVLAHTILNPHHVHLLIGRSGSA